MFGHSGHGLSAARSTGGAGSSSSCVTDAAPWRCAVPRQSAPVSPPPMMTTCLPAAEIAPSVRDGVALAASVLLRQVLHREVHARQIAARHGQVARPAGAAGQDHGVEVAPQVAGGDVHADVHAGPEHHALGLQQLEPPIEHALLHLELGDAVAQQPADAIGLLEHGDAVARAVQLRPPRPARPGRTRPPPPSSRCARSAASGTIQPSSKARSTIASSIDLMVTGSLLMPSTHEPSHGAGHSRPVNSGKLLVCVQALECRAPRVAVDQVVPVRDQVAERAALMAERDAAVHAARGLPGEVVRRVAGVDVAVVAAPAPRRAGSAPSARANSMKPVALPIVTLPPGSLNAGCRASARGRGFGRAHALEVARGHDDERAAASCAQSPSTRAATALPVSTACRAISSCTRPASSSSSSRSRSTMSGLQRRWKVPSSSST